MSSNNELSNFNRYRALAMIKLGEWFDSRDMAFTLAVQTIYSKVDTWIEDGYEEESAADLLVEIMTAVRLLDEILDDFTETRASINNLFDGDGYKGEVYLTNKNACAKHRKVTILPAVVEPIEYQQKTPKKKVVKSEA